VLDQTGHWLFESVLFVFVLFVVCVVVVCVFKTVTKATWMIF